MQFSREVRNYHASRFLLFLKIFQLPSQYFHVFKVGRPVLVVDNCNHHVQKFTSDGHSLTAVDTHGSDPLQLTISDQIPVNSNNNKIYVADKHKNSDLTFSSTFGKKGSNKGQSCEPFDVACDRSGNVYVADSGNHHIQVFTADLKFLGGMARSGGNLDGFMVLLWTLTTWCTSMMRSTIVCLCLPVVSGDQLVTSFGRKGAVKLSHWCCRGQ